MENQALCQYKHGSVWSKDYDSVGGKKRLCLYMYNTQKKKKTFNSANAGPKPGWKRRWVMHFACKSIILIV
jgi:hypothetical protein